MRTPNEILADPQATHAELDSLPMQYQQQVASHANCPAEFWWSLLSDFPIDALSSPAAPLYMLEDPAHFARIWHGSSHLWLSTNIFLLDEHRLQAFLADCGERVYPIWEEHNADDHTMRAALDARRDFSASQLSLPKLKVILGKAEEYLEKQGYTALRRNLYADILQSAGYAISDRQAMGNREPIEATLAARSAKGFLATESGGDWHVAHLAEGRWQWNRFYQYVRQIKPELPHV